MSTGADWVEQARLLFEALRGGLASTVSAPSGADEDEAHGADCRWCPLCQAAAVVRGERPEVTAALADVLTTAAAALRNLAGEPQGPAGPDGAPDDEPGDPPPTAQRIEIA